MLLHLLPRTMRSFAVATVRVVLISAAVFSSRAEANGKSGAPVMTRIDPPNWWAGMPDPMLLVYGEHLQGARFTVGGAGVRLIHQQISANGHYAFLSLATHGAVAASIDIAARTRAGSSRHAFALERRRSLRGRAQGFSSADVMYLIMPDRFARAGTPQPDEAAERARPRGWHGGNLNGVRNHLEYQAGLGVTTLWMTPVVDNGSTPESYHGYAATDLYAIDPHLGTLNDYRALADSLHVRGMKLVFDIVPNHISVRHRWMDDPPAPDWFHGTREQHDRVRFDFPALTDPHAPPAASDAVTHGWFTDSMPDLNQENPLVARYLIDNALWWIETAGLDGFRIDTYPYVSRAFWHEFSATVHAVYPRFTMVGEVLDRDPTLTSFFAGGIARSGPDGVMDTGLDTPFDYPVYFALRDTLAHDEPMTRLRDALRMDALYPHPERLVFFAGNHDQSRFLTAAGNRRQRLLLVNALLATMRGMPQLYAGDEVGMEGGDDPDNRRDFPGGFPDADGVIKGEDGFQRRTAGVAGLYDWDTRLFALRAHEASLQRGTQQDLFVDNSRFAFVRATDPARGSQAASPPVLVVVDRDRPDDISPAHALEPGRELALATRGTALEHCHTAHAAFPPGQPDVVLQGETLAAQPGPTGVVIYELH